MLLGVSESVEELEGSVGGHMVPAAGHGAQAIFEGENRQAAVDSLREHV